MERRSKNSAGAAAGILVLGLLTGVAAAASDLARLDVSVGDVAGEGWRATGVEVELVLHGATQLAARVSVRGLELPGEAPVVRGLHGACQRVELDGGLVQCRGLSLSADAPGLPVLSGDATFDRHTRAVTWDLRAGDAQGGLLTLSGSARTDGWRVDFRARSWPVQALVGLAKSAGYGDVLPEGEVGGVLSGTVAARGGAGGPQRLEFDLRTAGLEGSSEDGRTAVASMDLEVTGELVSAGADLAFDVRVACSRGEGYREPVYADLGQHPLSFRVEGHRSNGVVDLSVPSFDQAGVVSGHGQLWLQSGEEGWTVAAGLVGLDRIALPGAYTVFLQPFLAGTDLDDMQTRGTMRAEARMADGAFRYVSLSFEGVDADDRGQRLAVYGLRGDLSWAPAAVDVPVRPASLAWEGGFVYGIPVGASRLGFKVGPGGWTLEAPARIPVLDGALAIRAFSMGDFTEGNARMSFDAELEPISMRGLARALDWPPMSGTLSGHLPELTYADGDLAIGGVLETQVFDGRVRVSKFRLREPFRAGSLLEADMKLEGLDLEQLTEAFSFGRITGTLDGYVRGLEVIDWSPVAFDARFYTPKDDPRRHRISQRAVDNIASLGGGGGAAALSKGFLKFFEEFGYGRMALGCRLQGDVCHMSGVKPADTGYYILTGRGLPRIEVVGFADRVNWPTLVAQLKAIVESEGPVVR